MKHHHTWNNKHAGVEGFIHVAKMILFRCLFCSNCYLTSSFMYPVRRNTSVDESYEWDSADACVDSEVLEATKFDQPQKGYRRGRGEPRCDQAAGLQDQRQKGNHSFYVPTVC